jgi:NAD(P)-dependent dehydrogenase (short-subunit alcohol dehydrogenase family)
MSREDEGATSEFAGAVSVVTGAAGGIGRAVVDALSARGALVAALDLADPPAGALRLRCDVTDEQQLTEALERACKELGTPTHLVCAAGVASEAPVVDMDVNEWRRVVDVSLLGTFVTTRQVLPAMLANGRGRIVALSSGYARKGQAAGSHYAAAKAGVETFVKSLALEVAGAGITVNAVAPGPVATAMLDPFMARSGWRPAMEAAIPLGRVATPADIAGPILFLLSDDSAYMTGQVLHVNGGLLMP